MEQLYGACRALYETAFPGAPKAWDDALFRHVMPDCLRVIREGDTPLAMLFSIPYPIVTPTGETEARYLYAVATDPKYRGRGLATRLLSGVVAEGYPVFLRPSSPSLFAFYQKAGLSPISPVLTEEGAAERVDGVPIRHLTQGEYLAAREAFLQPPYTRPTTAFLELGFSLGGAVALTGEFAAFYERHGDTVYFKEWLGNRAYAPYAAAFLGAAAYRLRTPDPAGTPFGMAANCPSELKFLIALD